MNLSRDERIQFVERSSDELPVTMQAELLSLNRSSLYYRPQPLSATEVGIKHRIDELYTQWPFYGSRKITAQLQQEGVEVNRKAVQRHMREYDITCIRLHASWMYLVAILDWYSRSIASWELDQTLEMPFTNYEQHEEHAVQPRGIPYNPLQLFSAVRLGQTR